MLTKRLKYEAKKIKKLLFSLPSLPRDGNHPAKGELPGSYGVRVISGWELPLLSGWRSAQFRSHRCLGRSPVCHRLSLRLGDFNTQGLHGGAII